MRRCKRRSLFFNDITKDKSGMIVYNIEYNLECIIPLPKLTAILHGIDND